ncbi:MAG: type IV pilin protein [Cyanobacteriota bacterium]|jgi:type IV pilus assembly protein PilA
MSSPYRLILNIRERNQGFTLLELIVTIIFIGILAVLSYPVYTKQAGKARESEVKFIIGTINRGQQAYHWEKGVFAQGADDTASLVLLNTSVSSAYITSLNIVANPNNATVAPNNLNFADFQIKGYSGGMFAGAGNYSQVICQAPEVSLNTPPPVAPNDCVTGIIIE